MNILKLNNDNIPVLAEFMAQNNREWWDFEGAAEQLGKLRR